MIDEILTNKNINNVPIRVTFEVVCDSNLKMYDGATPKDKLYDYIRKCADAIDDKMKHWKDHAYIVKPTSVQIQNEQNLMINVSDKVLDNHAITELSNYKIKLHNDTIIHNDKVYDKLMDKPRDLDDYDFIVMYGRYLHSEIPEDGYPSYWIYPDDWTENIEHIEDKIEDDKLYKVWVDHGYPHDPTDHTEFNYVKYIERTEIQ